MGKPDYAKLKALSQQILECIGDEPEGEGQHGNTKPDKMSDDNHLGAEDDGTLDFLPGKLDDSETETDGHSSGSGTKKKAKDHAMKIMASTLGAKFKSK